MRAVVLAALHQHAVTIPVVAPSDWHTEFDRRAEHGLADPEECLLVVPVDVAVRKLRVRPQVNGMSCQMPGLHRVCNYTTRLRAPLRVQFALPLKCANTFADHKVLRGGCDGALDNSDKVGMYANELGARGRRQNVAWHGVSHWTPINAHGMLSA